MMDRPEIIQAAPQTWRIEDGFVRFFLLAGTERALLIDSGMTVRGVPELARSLTELPVELLNTHADRDHIGGNAEFPFAYMNPAECANYRQAGGDSRAIRPVWDGDIIDLGDRPLEIVAIPGHTPGSVAILDRKNRVLFSGDTVQDGDIFLFGPYRDVFAVPHSLRKLEGRLDEFDSVYPSHGTASLPAGVVTELREGMERLLRGELSPEARDFRGMQVKACRVGPATALLDTNFSV